MDSPYSSRGGVDLVPDRVLTGQNGVNHIRAKVNQRIFFPAFQPLHTISREISGYSGTHKPWNFASSSFSGSDCAGKVLEMAHDNLVVGRDELVEGEGEGTRNEVEAKDDAALLVSVDHSIEHENL